jgi:hypothetical protein
MNRSQPLWMPRGSVRAILALALVAALIALVLSGQAIPDAFAPIVASVVAFYFAGKPPVPPTNGNGE